VVAVGKRNWCSVLGNGMKQRELGAHAQIFNIEYNLF